MKKYQSLRHFTHAAVAAFGIGLLGAGQANALELTTDPNNWVRIEQRYDASMDLDPDDIPDDAVDKGLWSAPFGWPMNGLHSVVLPDGKILSYGPTPAAQPMPRRFTISGIRIPDLAATATMSEMLAAFRIAFALRALT